MLSEGAVGTIGISRRSFLSGAGMAVAGLRARSLWGQPEGLPVTVRTRQGVLRGEQLVGANVYRGVPFATPPVGPLRFRRPEPVRPWSGERDATQFGAAAMQPGVAKLPSGEPAVRTSEDCLYLNVWEPQTKGPHPVYVWIHGGGFTAGWPFGAMFDGTELARAGIVCVTVAYRLGVFGFLDLEPVLGASYAGSANNALRDLMMALTWIKENVEEFGGDPERVTIGGESAGAKLTDILLGTPAAKELFHQGISESGGAERVWPRETSVGITEGFAKMWRDQSGGPAEALATADAEKIMAAQDQFVKEWPQHFPLRVEIDGELLPVRPVETIAAGSGAGKRLLIGTNREESAAFLGPHPEHDPEATDLGNLPLARFDEVFAKYPKIYPEMSEEMRRIRAATAEEYWVPSVRVAEAEVKSGGAVWMYRLDFAETSGRLKGYAFHSLDTKLVWDRPTPWVGNAGAEAIVSSEMFDAWKAFIHGETPAAAGVPEWPEYTEARRATMIFDTRNRVETLPQEAELRLWDGAL